jgi:hypothetical protein
VPRLHCGANEGRAEYDGADRCKFLRVLRLWFGPLPGGKERHWGLVS